MKILFICGSLEPGKDGVGDYTRRLCSELNRQEHHAQIIAWNDRYIQEIVKENQFCDDQSIAVLRISSNLKRKNRIIKAKKYVEEFNPDWLSLQFVPFAFQNKGLPFFLANELVQIGGNRKWHIMFHELWVEDLNLKSQIWAQLQRFIIRQINSTLNPLIAHTHIPIYQQRLKTQKIKSLPLPLFSNIKYVENLPSRSSIFTLGFFSQVSDQKDIILFIQDLNYEIRKRHQQMKIVLIGGNPQRMNKFSELLETKLDNGVKIITTGNLNEHDLSKQLAQCDMGITPVPQHLLGKSGSVAAFLSHSVPVAAPFVKPGFEDCNIGFFDDSLKRLIRTSPQIISSIDRTGIVDKFTITSIAAQFISDLYQNKQ